MKVEIDSRELGLIVNVLNNVYRYGKAEWSDFGRVDMMSIPEIVHRLRSLSAASKITLEGT